MPTIALSNSICFRRMANPGQEFPPIRVLGTIGWIVVGGLLSYLDIEDSANQFLLASGVSLVTGIYCFFLPDTPPALKGNPGSVRDILGLDALKLMKNTSFAVMVVSSVLICIPLAFYYGFANPFLNELRMEDAAGKMTLGQASELFFMLVMPFFFVRLGFKKMILLGMAAWVLRYVMFAFGNTGSLEWMLYAGIILHGICYDFFFVTGQIFVDRRAPEHLRSSAQGMITFATYGLGMFIGSQVAGQVVGANTLDQNTHVWQSIWLVPAVASAIVLVIFAVLFREKDEPKEELKAKAA
jgi:nucleoside transporter